MTLLALVVSHDLKGGILYGRLPLIKCRVEGKSINHITHHVLTECACANRHSNSQSTNRRLFSEFFLPWMPARLSSMELSRPSTPDSVSADNNDATSRRKSARARQKPVFLQEELYASSYSNGSNKRKRAKVQRVAVPAEDPADPKEMSEEESESDDSDGEPDPEEVKDKRKRKAPAPKKNPAKPAAKKLKTADAQTLKLPVRPAINGTGKASKPKKIEARISPAVSNHETGLYGMLKHSLQLRMPRRQSLICGHSRSVLPRAHSRWSGSRLDDAL